jgi:membrane protease YdiL (CAAX protease family)
MNQMQENAKRLTGIVPRLSLWGFFGVAVVIGVYEELVFRGFLMTRLRRATRSWTAAVLISTAVFTALHALDQTPVALIWIAMLSLIFSVVTIWRRSIAPAIVAHILFNFTQFIGLALQSGESWK